MIVLLGNCACSDSFIKFFVENVNLRLVFRRIPSGRKAVDEFSHSCFLFVNSCLQVRTKENGDCGQR